MILSNALIKVLYSKESPHNVGISGCGRAIATEGGIPALVDLGIVDDMAVH